jgi:hypothetical protein
MYRHHACFLPALRLASARRHRRKSRVSKGGARGSPRRSNPAAPHPPRHCRRHRMGGRPSGAACDSHARTLSRGALRPSLFTTLGPVGHASAPRRWREPCTQADTSISRLTPRPGRVLTPSERFSGTTKGICPPLVNGASGGSAVIWRPLAVPSTKKRPPPVFCLSLGGLSLVGFPVLGSPAGLH